MERNYVIINNVNSTTINGLYIKDLPPITKPLMRNTKEEIDGRDGDIITRLGYSAYDKEMTIGLAGDYDINEVISFFNPEPSSLNTVIPPYVMFVFSNEPNKQYWGQILDQIDYNALLKFKTATVKIHCQPFKYSATSDRVNASSSSITFTNDGNIYSKPIITLTGYGVVDVTLNGTQYFSVDLGGSSGDVNIVTLYTAWSEATTRPFSDSTIEYANRQITGDYNSFKVPVGENTLECSGTGVVGIITIQLRSRWI